MRGHLDAALAQDAANGTNAVVVTFVLYNLPNRDCQRAAGSGELSLAGVLERYQAEFIDAIRAIAGHTPNEP